MYLDFYGLSKLPFHITPNPAFLYPSPSHREALASIIYAIKEKKGFLAITGEVGVGKTTILRSYLDDVGSDKISVVYVFNPVLSFKSLLKLICGELAVAADTEDEFELVNRLHFALIDLYAQGRTLVLIVDEAQNMPMETIEKLRMLSNLETSEDKLIQVILMGQPEFERMLHLEQLRQLKQRIAIRSTILPLTKQDSLDYIQYRLKKAGSKDSSVFTRKALSLIVGEAKGIPRMINILCDNALITGFGYQKKPVTGKIVKEVLRDFGNGRHPHGKGLWLAAASLAAIAVLLGAAFYGGYLQPLSGTVAMIPPAPLPETRQEAPLPGPQAIPATVPTTQQQESAESLAPEKETLDDQASTTAQASERSIEIAETGGTAPLEAAAVRGDSNGTPPATPGTVEAHEEVAVPTETAFELAQPEIQTEAAQIVVVVKTGDNISSLIRGIYGRVDRDLLAAVRSNNPHIKNLSMIKPGEKLTFSKAFPPSVLPKTQE